MSGPMRKAYAGHHRRQVDVAMESVIRVAGPAFAANTKAQKELAKLRANYLAEHAAIRASPIYEELIKATVEHQKGFAKLICWLSDPMPRLSVNRKINAEDHERFLQFHGVVGELLEASGSSTEKFKLAAESALEAMRTLDLHVTSLNAGVEKAAKKNIFAKHSESDLCRKFFVSLLNLLVRNGLDSDLSDSSLITLIVMGLEGRSAEKPSVGADSDNKSHISKESADREAKYRKTLASSIRNAVTASKGAVNPSKV